MTSIMQYVERRLKLKVNRQKTAVDLAKKRRLLGFRFYGRDREVKVRIDPGARKRAKDRLRQLTSRKWGVSMEQRIDEINRFTVGWTNYYALADTPSVFEGLDEWLRRRLRQVRWKEWKRANARRRNLIAQGIPVREATEWSHSRKGYWRVSGSPILTRALPNAYWATQGLKGFTDPYRRFREC
jgi:RNA-directed DNA polymerase